jgi:hypothetical protein
MFRRDTQAGSLYWLGHRDATGAYLDGGRAYKLTVPLPVPGKLFWSVTVYDARTRSQIQTCQGKALLSSLFDFGGTADADSVDLLFGPDAPAGHQDRWVQTNPGAGWFVYFRIYGPSQPPSTGPGNPETSNLRPNRARSGDGPLSVRGRPSAVEPPSLGLPGGSPAAGLTAAGLTPVLVQAKDRKSLRS